MSTTTTDAATTTRVTFTRDDTCPVCGQTFTITYEADDEGVRAVDVPDDAVVHAAAHLDDPAEAALETLPGPAAPDSADEGQQVQPEAIMAILEVLLASAPAATRQAAEAALAALAA